MLQFIVTPPGQRQLRVNIYPEQHRIETNISVDMTIIKQPKMCNKCQESQTRHHCNLLRAIVPVLIYFSEFLSYEKVTIEYIDEDCTAQFVETAQRAGFILCIYTMFHSSCDYFSQFSFLLKYYRVNITYEIFMHLVLTTSLLKRQVDLNTVHDQVDIFAEVKAMATEFRNRLVYILEDARVLEKKDAAVNALNIIFSLNSLSADFLKEYYQNFLDTIIRLKPTA